MADSSPVSVDKELVAKKLQQLERYLLELDGVMPPRLQGYVKNNVTRRAIERLLQLCIECASDINAHVLAKSAGVVPPDYFMSFIIAGERGIITSELATELAPSAGLRNKLVHEYGNVDDELVYEGVRKAASLFPRYIREVKNYIEAL